MGFRKPSQNQSNNAKIRIRRSRKLDVLVTRVSRKIIVPKNKNGLSKFNHKLNHCGKDYPISADPALAKAGAAPGTTAGVELFFFPNALHFPRATQAIALSVHRPGATQATAISVHFPRATHAAISVSTAFPDATGRGRPCAAPTSP